jgi:hypothetical protein
VDEKFQLSYAPAFMSLHLHELLASSIVHSRVFLENGHEIAALFQTLLQLTHVRAVLSHVPISFHVLIVQLAEPGNELPFLLCVFPWIIFVINPTTPA